MLNSTQRIRNLSEQPDNQVRLIAIDDKASPELTSWDDAIILCLVRLDEEMDIHHRRLYQSNGDKVTYNQGDILQLVEEGFIVLAIRDETLVGVLAVSTNDGETVAEVTHVYVQEEVRGKKIAAMMLGKAESLAREKGVKYFKVQLYTGNEAAEKTYTRGGYLPGQSTLVKPL